jgi:hypothetical protein
MRYLAARVETQRFLTRHVAIEARVTRAGARDPLATEEPKRTRSNRFLDLLRGRRSRHALGHLAPIGRSPKSSRGQWIGDGSLLRVEGRHDRGLRQKASSEAQPSVVSAPMRLEHPGSDNLEVVNEGAAKYHAVVRERY